MSNDKPNTKDATTAAQDKRAAQQAQQAEANGTRLTFDFDGYTYELRKGQPSPRALTYVARWSVDDERLALLLAIAEMIGQAQWDAWCERHDNERINDFWTRLNEVAGGNS